VSTPVARRTASESRAPRDKRLIRHALCFSTDRPRGGGGRDHGAGGSSRWHSNPFRMPPASGRGSRTALSPMESWTTRARRLTCTGTPSEQPAWSADDRSSSPWPPSSRSAVRPDRCWRPDHWSRRAVWQSQRHNSLHRMPRRL